MSMTKALCKDIKKRGKWHRGYCDVCDYCKRCVDKHEDEQGHDDERREMIHASEETPRDFTGKI